jgi:hypothetical protein
MAICFSLPFTYMNRPASYLTKQVTNQPHSGCLNCYRCYYLLLVTTIQSSDLECSKSLLRQAVGLLGWEFKSWQYISTIIREFLLGAAA